MFEAELNQAKEHLEGAITSTMELFDGAEQLSARVRRLHAELAKVAKELDAIHEWHELQIIERSLLHAREEATKASAILEATLAGTENSDALRAIERCGRLADVGYAGIGSELNRRFKTKYFTNDLPALGNVEAALTALEEMDDTARTAVDRESLRRLPEEALSALEDYQRGL